MSNLHQRPDMFILPHGVPLNIAPEKKWDKYDSPSYLRMPKKAKAPELKLVSLPVLVRRQAS